MRNPESADNEVFKSFQEQEKGGFTRWVGDRRKEVAALIGGMVLLSGGLAEAGKNKPVETKEKTTATSVEKADAPTKRTVKNILKERSLWAGEAKIQTDSFSLSIDSGALEALKKQGVALSGNKLIVRGGALVLNAEVKDSKTLKVEIKTLPNNIVELTSFNSDGTRDVAHVVDGDIKAMNKITPAK